MHFLRNSFKYTHRCSNLLLNQCCKHCQCCSRYLCSAVSKKTSGPNCTVPVSCGCTTRSCQGLCIDDLLHTKILRRALHVSGCGRRTKQHDDEPDFNIDFENELMWLKDSFTNASSQPSSNSNSAEVPKETLQKQWLSSSFPETKPLKSSMKHDYKLWSRNVLPPYRGNHVAKFKTGKSAPPLTADVAVELLTCELRDLFGYDRTAAYEVASWVRKSYYCCYGVVYPALTDTDLVGTRKIVEDTMATVRAYVAEGMTPSILYAVPMLVRVSAEDLPQKLELLQKAEFFPVGAPFLLLPLSGLEMVVTHCLLERQVLPQRADRLHFIANIFKIDAVTVACHVANTNFDKFFARGLRQWACLADACNFYRIPTEAVLANFRYIIKNRSMLLHRFDALARMHNPPEVLAALAYDNLGKTLVQDSLRKALAKSKDFTPDKNIKFFFPKKIDKTSRGGRDVTGHRITDTPRAAAPPPHPASLPTSPSPTTPATPSPHHPSQEGVSACRPDEEAVTAPDQAGKETKAPVVAKERKNKKRGKKQRAKDAPERLQQVFEKYIEDAGSSVSPQDGARLLERYTPPDLHLACSYDFKLPRSAEQRTEDTKGALAQPPSLP